MIKTVASSPRTDRHTADTWTDKSLKTEGPMILSIDIFHFKTVIIGGPIIAIISRNSEVFIGLCLVVCLFVCYFLCLCVQLYYNEMSNYLAQ